MNHSTDISTIQIESVSPTQIQTRLGEIEICDIGEGPPVLCLHGAMGGYDQGLILAKTLGESGYRYLAPSRPGYLGTAIKDRSTPEAQADLLAALLDALDIDQAAVMAISGGGPSAIHFALQHKDRCLALVLVSTAACPAQTKRLPLAFHLTALLMRFPPLARAAGRNIERRHEQMARRSITHADLLEKTRNNHEAWALIQSLQRSTVDRIPQRYPGTLNDVALTANGTYPLSSISQPTLIVHGTEDPFVPFSQHAKLFLEQIPNAEIVPLKRGEHAAIFTHRDEARAAVTAFLRRRIS